MNGPREGVLLLARAFFPEGDTRKELIMPVHEVLQQLLDEFLAKLDASKVTGDEDGPR